MGTQPPRTSLDGGQSHHVNASSTSRGATDHHIGSIAALSPLSWNGLFVFLMVETLAAGGASHPLFKR